LEKQTLFRTATYQLNIDPGRDLDCVRVNSRPRVKRCRPLGARILLSCALWKVEGLLSIAEKMKLDSELCEKMLRHHAAPVTSATILKKIDFYYLFSHNA
jgi:hypothetical protein